MDRVKIGIAALSFIWACVISAIALFLPPQGEIDTSVLILIAQLLILVTTIVGVKMPLIINKNDTKLKT